MDQVTLALLLATQTFNLPPGLLSAVCWTETKHAPQAIHVDDNGSDSLGLCQIKYSTARWLGYNGSPKTLQINPVINAYYAGAYLNYQYNRYGHNVVKAVAAYNAGRAKYSNNKPINYQYVNDVFRALAEKR